MHVVSNFSRTVPALWVACAALLMLLAAVPAARAAGASQVAVGLHVATGALVDPNGRTWVSDHNAGFCRLTEATDTRPSRIDHPDRADVPGARTCLGGLLPDAQPGPGAAGQPAFLDPSPEFPSSGDELAFIPDGSAASADVTRARWNPSTGRFQYQDTIFMTGPRVRPTAAAVGPDDDVYVTFQRDSSIQRIVNADAGVPTVERVGRTSDGRGAGAMAAGRDADGKTTIFVAESVGLRLLHPDPQTAPTTVTGYDVQAPAAPGGPGPATIAGLAYDPARSVLWAGTADVAAPADAGADRLVRIDIPSGAVTDQATAFTAVTGLGLTAAGNALVLDDPALVEPQQPLGLGRLFSVGQPVAHVTRGPLDDAGIPGRDAALTRDATPAFDVAGDGVVQCLLRGPGLSGNWTDCPADGRLQVTDALADGEHTLSVRSVDAGVTGLPEVHAFRVDTHAPSRPRILSPVDGAPTSPSPWFSFDAEDGSTLACRIDDAAPAPCRAGRVQDFVDGLHHLEVIATDPAGNVSDASLPVSFTVDVLLPVDAPVTWDTGTPTHRGSTLYVDGLHLSTGAIVDPDGRLWVSDHNAGFCRLVAGTDTGPGRIDHPQIPGAPGPHTCIGGLLPGALPGPNAAGGPTFVDPTPMRPGSGDEVALIPDGAAASSEVFRVRWNPHTSLFEPLDTVTMVNAGRGVRPIAASTGPDGNVYVVFQKSPTIQRISAPATDGYLARVVGSTADGRGATAVAAGRDALGRLSVYVGESNGLGVVRPNATTRPLTAPSFDLPGPAGVPAPATPVIGALAYDEQRDHLWVGTAHAADVAQAGTDLLHKVDVTTGTIVAAHAKGYTMVGGVTVRPDGMVFVLDDPGLLQAVPPLGSGHMFEVGLPAAHIVRGPLGDDGVAASDRAFTNDPTPAFDVQGDAMVECRLSGVWAPCAADGRFQVTEPLADGAYRLAVRSVDGAAAGLAEGHRFTVDTEAPQRPVITSPRPGVVNADPWFTFAAEDGARFSCRWDDEPVFAPCTDGHTRTFTENGTHTLAVKAIDRAGNASAASQPLMLDARGKVTRLTIDSGPEGLTQDASPTFAFSADATDVEFGCRISGQAFGICSSPKHYDNLADGTYVFEVRARDSAGNVTPLSRRTFVVDRTAPRTTVSSPAEGAVVGQDVTVQMAADEATTWRCRLDDAAFEPCGGQRAYLGLVDGEHVFQVIGTDTAGNVADVVTRRFGVSGSTVVAPPAAPGPPSVTVLDAATRTPLTIAITAIDRRVNLAQIQGPGIAVTVLPPRGAKLVRFRIFRIAPAAVIAATGRPSVTVYRAVVAGKEAKIRLTRKELRRLHPGRYRLEVSAGSDRTRLGRAVTSIFTVTR